MNTRVHAKRIEEMLWSEKILGDFHRGIENEADLRRNGRHVFKIMNDRNLKKRNENTVKFKNGKPIKESL